MRRLATVVVVAWLTAPAAAVAAPITWDSPVLVTGNPSDIVTTGTSFGAAVIHSSDVVVNGVNFTGLPPTCGVNVTYAFASNITASGWGCYNAVGPGPVTGSYASLVNDGVYGASGNVPTITISGLSVGNLYLLQFIQPNWNFNYRTVFSDGVNDSAQVSSGTGGFSQYLTGTFTADGTSQTVFLEPVTAHAVWSSLQVRTLEEAAAPVPEPATLMLVGGGAAMALRRRRRGR